jgi:hypothetical protein
VEGRQIMSATTERKMPRSVPTTPLRGVLSQLLGETEAAIR